MEGHNRWGEKLVAWGWQRKQWLEEVDLACGIPRASDLAAGCCSCIGTLLDDVAFPVSKERAPNWEKRFDRVEEARVLTMENPYSSMLHHQSDDQDDCYEWPTLRRSLLLLPRQFPCDDFDGE